VIKFTTVTSPDFPQLATAFQQLSTKAQSLAQQLQGMGTGGSSQLVTVSAAGPYTVNIPSGATAVDRVLCGAGGGGGGYGNGTAYNGGTGGQTTASVTGAPELTAAGGNGGTGSTTATTTSGASPGIETFNGANYTGGQGGAFGPGGPLASIPGAVIVLRFSGRSVVHRGGKVNCRVRLFHQGIGVLVSA
jgi:hypothetical protein